MAEALSNESGVGEPLRIAREALQQTLAYLDASDAPADIGAHVDLALHRLDQYLSSLAAS